MNRDLQKAPQLFMLPTVDAADVPSPGDGPVIFADSGNSNALTVKLTDGTTIVVASVPTPIEVTGSTGANAALQNLLAALETLGLITDSTT